MDPIKLFTKWYQEEQHLCNIKIPSACCFSTNGLDGYPNARFVSLKEVLDGRFIITGPVSSRKGREILKSTKTSLSFWWTVTERQVRIQGDATKISDQHADNYFNERSRESQLISLISKQGMTLENIQQLNDDYQKAIFDFTGKEIPRPADWGGYSINPVRIEFLKFNEARFHERILFERKKEQWTVRHVQP